MNQLLIIFSLLFLIGNYFAYKEKVNYRYLFPILAAAEIGSAIALYQWSGYSNELIIVTSSVLIFTLISYTLPHFLPRLQGLIWAEISFLVQTSSFMLFRINPSLAIRHIVLCFLGLALILPIHWVVKYFNTSYRYSFLYYALAVVLLLMNNVTRYGATNWTKIGDIMYQPSEFVKILFSLFLASFLLKKYTWKGFLSASVLSLSIIAILVRQKDLGAAFIFFTIYVVITYMYSHNKVLLLFQFLAAGIAAIASIQLFHHVQVRIISWLYPFQYAQKEGFQIVRSLQALMNGKWWGTGLGRGNPDRIPVVTSDFLFAAIGEEYGSLYLILFLVHFFFLILLLYNQCLKSRNKFYFYTGTGLTTMLAIQGFLIMAGSSGMIPLTGVVLPFVSYGGSAMVGNFAIVAMIENMTKLSQTKISDNEGDRPVHSLAKYIKILKIFVFILYLSHALYLIWLFQFWQMPNISN